MAEYNRTCPLCGDDHGVPRTVTAEGGTFMVTLICDTCGHQWATERKPDLQLFQFRQHPSPLHIP